MTGFYNLKTAHKLTLGFGLLFVWMLLLSSLALLKTSIMSQATDGIVTDAIPVSNAARDILMQMVNKETGLRGYLVTGQEGFLAPYIAGREQTGKDFDLLSTHYADHPVMKALIEGEVKPEAQQIDRFSDTLIAEVRAGKKADAQKHIGEGKAQMDAFRGTMDKVFTDTDKVVNDANTVNKKAYQETKTAIVGCTLLALLFSLLIGVLITRYITGALAQISSRITSINNICIANLNAAVEALEQGDLTVQIGTGTKPLTSQAKDEFGQMAKTFNQMLAKLQATIGSFCNSQAGLRSLVQQMQHSAAQVDSAAQMLSGTSQQIGASTEQIGATMHEVAQASEQSARGASEIAQGSSLQASAVAAGAEQVKELVAAIQGVTRDTEAATKSAEQATKTAADGASAVEQTVAGMERIHSAVSESAGVIASLGETSAKIGGIVQTIDEIAGQTNLLALNAAIEAARAGEAGRGFAVVADEVRKLAERCTMATKDIGGLIGDIQSQTQRAVSAMEQGTREVASGTSLASEAGAALARIQSVVSAMSGQVLSISAAAEEMAASAAEVSGTISEVAAVIEESSASAEEMSASAEEVSASVQTVAGTTSQQGAAVEELVASASELAGVSETLTELISQFKTDGSGSQSSTGKPHLTLRKVA